MLSSWKANLDSTAGLYADLELVALRPMDPLVMTHRLVLASAPAADGLPQAFTSEWMASARWHPFWLFALARVVKAAAVNGTRCSTLRAKGLHPSLLCEDHVSGHAAPSSCAARAHRVTESALHRAVCARTGGEKDDVPGPSVPGSFAHCGDCHLTALRTSLAARHRPG